MRSCPVCSGTYAAVILADKPHDIVNCSNCGMVYADTDRPQAWYDTHYAEQGLYSESFEEWNKDRYVTAAIHINNLVKDKKAKIVDIGCSTGGLLKALADLGKFESLYGVDPAHDIDRKQLISRDESLISLVKGSIWKFEGTYDCIILSHVLEHIVDVNKAVQRVCQRAKSVYVEVPDASRYGLRERSPYQQFNEEHINHFDVRKVMCVFSYFGFMPVACGRGWCAAGPNDHDMTFPTCWAFFERTGNLRDSIAAYSDKSAQQMGGIKEKLSKIQGPVIAWGIGALARRLEPLLIFVYAALDANPVGKFWGHTICKPANLEVAYDDVYPFAGIPILVTTILHKDSVLADIKRLGLKNEVITLG